MMNSADPIGALAGAPSPPRAGAVWTAFVETVTDLNASRAGWPAELERARLWYEPHLDRIHEDSGTRHADLIQLEQIERLSFQGAFPDRTYARSAGRDERPGRRAAARRGLSDPFD